MRPYHYRCKDYSLLTPPFKQWVISPLINLVPWVIPANVITLISNSFVYLGLFLALQPQVLGDYTPPFIAFCLLLYLIGDHLDGMQAKRTGTGSALGEFCDHYLDAFNNGIIVFTLFVAFDIRQPIMISLVLVIAYMAHMAVFYEQFKTGWLTFERIGSLESVLLTALLIGCAGIDAFYQFMSYDLVAGLTVIEIIILSSALGAFGTFVQTFRRTPDVKTAYWIFVFLLAVVGITGTLVLNDIQLFVIITLYASLYIGRLMYGHLIDGVESQADWLVPVALLFFVFLGSNNSMYIFWITTVYLAIRIMILIVKSFSTLGIYWVWQNART